MADWVENMKASQSTILKQRVQEGQDIIAEGNYDDTHSLSDILKEYGA